MNPPIALDVARTLPGYIKVRLVFNTWDPQHIRSHMLKTEHNLEPPFIENISVLVPVEDAYNRLSAYDDAFNTLKECGVLALADKLKDFELREEDILTLAYYERRDTTCS
jgi:hypothetical protein